MINIKEMIADREKLIDEIIKTPFNSFKNDWVDRLQQEIIVLKEIEKF